MGEKPNAKPIFVRMPVELHCTVKVTAVSEGVTLSELVERAVRVVLAAI
ncbi:MAG: hypothetical protein ACREM1_23190 [Longimicrobiales bacterium]